MSQDYKSLLCDNPSLVHGERIKLQLVARFVEVYAQLADEIVLLWVE
ncbi:hypothetical protein CK203_041019 [Vitis vinifera]|uniref:Uncharacterized protein n=1 Tax=Vitis vinifera TaxID=29760 RepID=A0A438H9J6_VITVI|nr:hypothetical protein CK203_041019 [Vitis vinifera]